MTMKSRHRKSCLLLVSLTWLAAGSADAADTVDYLREVKPLLREKCFACHGALKQEAGLRLDTGAFVRKGSQNGAVIHIENASISALIQRVTAVEESERMPLQGTPLTADQ